uniref:F-box domain-containing protein n=1 Tax=Chromera velia CCMP2878 TaxID=1169474 RepID=A0A0G4FN45_9ALVE|eukprot:Cvel_17868.t1-p1 / transcript=Cvel_17868.t1 / gene=Cvel_17868 / organism=Chromera_velia_CCMP2878 / gene_product=hypothetical protein / transcript_product=hypothetical protein / location=Cvel_scaffold1449:14890-15624(+) / protein_length=245 / sequence_SO=supercontig / SO=protein_coding / is_pseudo=false
MSSKEQKVEAAAAPTTAVDSPQRSRSLSRLPVWALESAFGLLGPRSLCTVVQVCSSWHAIVFDPRLEFWKGVCERVGLLDESAFSNARARAKKVNKSVAALRKARDKTAPNTPERAKADRAIIERYKSHWVEMRNRMCRHCKKAQKQTSCYDLYDNVLLCMDCRRMEPFAWISTTLCKRFFKFDPVGLKSMWVGHGNRSGSIYKLQDVEKKAEEKHGKEKAEEMSRKHRENCKIGQMRPPFFHDV